MSLCDAVRHRDPLNFAGAVADTLNGRPIFRVSAAWDLGAVNGSTVMIRATHPVDRVELEVGSTEAVASVPRHAIAPEPAEPLTLLGSSGPLTKCTVREGVATCLGGVLPVGSSQRIIVHTASLGSTLQKKDVGYVTAYEGRRRTLTEVGRVSP